LGIFIGIAVNVIGMAPTALPEYLIDFVLSSTSPVTNPILLSHLKFSHSSFTTIDVAPTASSVSFATFPLIVTVNGAGACPLLIPY
jgi:hypothetical protein